MVTKKDFNKIAQIISLHTSVQFEDDEAWRDNLVIKNHLVKELADYFESVNPNFHRGKFIHACFNKAKNKAA